MDQPTAEDVRRGHEIARALVAVRINATAEGQSPDVMDDCRHWIIDAADVLEGDRTLLLATLGALAHLAAVTVGLLSRIESANPQVKFKTIAACAVRNDITW